MGARATATGGTARGARNALGAFARLALLLAAIALTPAPADGGVHAVFPSVALPSGDASAVVVVGAGFFHTPKTACRFGGVVTRGDVIDASTFVCYPPPRPAAPRLGGANLDGFVDVEVSMNAADFTKSGAVFRYVEPASVASAAPHAGDAGGGSLVVATAAAKTSGFTEQSRCAFLFAATGDGGETLDAAEDEKETKKWTLDAGARFVSSAILTCEAPRARAAGAARVAATTAEAAAYGDEPDTGRQGSAAWSARRAAPEAMAATAAAPAATTSFASPETGGATVTFFLGAGAGLGEGSDAAAVTCRFGTVTTRAHATGGHPGFPPEELPETFSSRRAFSTATCATPAGRPSRGVPSPAWAAFSISDRAPVSVPVMRREPSAVASARGSEPVGDGASARDDAELVGVVATVTPRRVSTAGTPSAVAVTGSGFHARASRCVIDGVASAPAVVVSSALMLCELPASPGGVRVASAATSASPRALAAARADGATVTYAVDAFATRVDVTLGSTSGGTAATLSASAALPDGDAASVVAARFGALGPVATRFVSRFAAETVTPARRPGAVGARLDGGAGASAASTAYTLLFRYAEPGAVAAAIPTIVPVTGNVRVELFGWGSSALGGGPVTCAFSGAAPFRDDACVAPPGGVGFVAVGVAGALAADAGSAYVAYAPRPRVAGVAPRTNYARGGAVTALSGSDFPSRNSRVPATCEFGEFGDGARVAAPVAFVSSAVARCETPELAPGAMATLELAAGAAASPLRSASGAVVTVLATPRVLAAAPGGGPTRGGDVIAVAGENFVGVEPAACRIGSVGPLDARDADAAGALGLNAHTMLECVAPARGVGAARVAVGARTGAGYTDDDVWYEYVSALPVEFAVPSTAESGGDLGARGGLAVFGATLRKDERAPCVLGARSAPGKVKRHGEMTCGELAAHALGAALESGSARSPDAFAAFSTRLAGFGRGAFDAFRGEGFFAVGAGGVRSAANGELAVVFHFRKPAEAISARPAAGFAGGGTVVRVSGRHMTPETGCAFGSAVVYPHVSLESSALVRCESPAFPENLALGDAVAVAPSDALAPPGVDAPAFPLASRAEPVVLDVVPESVAGSGGTVVRVFLLGGVLVVDGGRGVPACAFAAVAPVAARLAVGDGGAAACVSPALARDPKAVSLRAGDAFGEFGRVGRDVAVRAARPEAAYPDEAPREGDRVRGGATDRPTAAAAYPDVASPAGGARVVVAGAFLDRARFGGGLIIGGARVRFAAVVSSALAFVEAPPRDATSSDAAVTAFAVAATRDDDEPPSVAFAFAFAASPEAISVSPKHVVSKFGGVVTVSGAFGEARGAGAGSPQCRFGSVGPVDARVVDATSAECAAPARAEGAIVVAASARGDTTFSFHGSSTAPLVLEYVDEAEAASRDAREARGPEWLRVERGAARAAAPAAAPRGGGARAHVLGENLGPFVAFGDVVVPAGAFVSSRLVLVETPPEPSLSLEKPLATRAPFAYANDFGETRVKKFDALRASDRARDALAAEAVESAAFAYFDTPAAVTFAPDAATEEGGVGLAVALVFSSTATTVPASACRVGTIGPLVGAPRLAEAGARAGPGLGSAATFLTCVSPASAPGARRVAAGSGLGFGVFLSASRDVSSWTSSLDVLTVFPAAEVTAVVPSAAVRASAQRLDVAGAWLDTACGGGDGARGAETLAAEPAASFAATFESRVACAPSSVLDAGARVFVAVRVAGLAPGPAGGSTRSGRATRVGFARLAAPRVALLAAGTVGAEGGAVATLSGDAFFGVAEGPFFGGSAPPPLACVFSSSALRGGATASVPARVVSGALATCETPPLAALLGVGGGDADVSLAPEGEPAAEPAAAGRVAAAPTPWVLARAPARGGASGGVAVTVTVGGSVEGVRGRASPGGDGAPRVGATGASEGSSEAPIAEKKLSCAFGAVAPVAARAAGARSRDVTCVSPAAQANRHGAPVPLRVFAGAAVTAPPSPRAPTLNRGDAASFRVDHEGRATATTRAASPGARALVGWGLRAREDCARGAAEHRPGAQTQTAPDRGGAPLVDPAGLASRTSRTLADAGPVGKGLVECAAPRGPAGFAALSAASPRAAFAGVAFQFARADAHPAVARVAPAAALAGTGDVLHAAGANLHAAGALEWRGGNPRVPAADARVANAPFALVFVSSAVAVFETPALAAPREKVEARLVGAADAPASDDDRSSVDHGHGSGSSSGSFAVPVAANRAVAAVRPAAGSAAGGTLVALSPAPRDGTKPLAGGGSRRESESETESESATSACWFGAVGPVRGAAFDKDTGSVACASPAGAPARRGVSTRLAFAPPGAGAAVGRAGAEAARASSLFFRDGDPAVPAALLRAVVVAPAGGDATAWVPSWDSREAEPPRDEVAMRHDGEPVPSARALRAFAASPTPERARARGAFRDGALVSATLAPGAGGFGALAAKNAAPAVFAHVPRAAAPELRAVVGPVETLSTGGALVFLSGRDLRGGADLGVLASIEPVALAGGAAASGGVARSVSSALAVFETPRVAAGAATLRLALGFGCAACPATSSSQPLATRPLGRTRGPVTEPAAFFAVPAAGGAGTTIRAAGDFVFAAGDALSENSRAGCRFRTTAVAASSVTATSVFCVAPALVPGVGVLETTFNGREYTAEGETRFRVAAPPSALVGVVPSATPAAAPSGVVFGVDVVGAGLQKFDRLRDMPREDRLELFGFDEADDAAYEESDAESSESSATGVSSGWRRFGGVVAARVAEASPSDDADRERAGVADGFGFGFGFVAVAVDAAASMMHGAAALEHLAVSVFAPPRTDALDPPLGPVRGGTIVFASGRDFLRGNRDFPAEEHDTFSALISAADGSGSALAVPLARVVSSALATFETPHLGAVASRADVVVARVVAGARRVSASTAANPSFVPTSDEATAPRVVGGWAASSAGGSHVTLAFLGLAGGYAAQTPAWCRFGAVGPVAGRARDGESGRELAGATRVSCVAPAAREGARADVWASENRRDWFAATNDGTTNSRDVVVSVVSFASAARPAFAFPPAASAVGGGVFGGDRGVAVALDVPGPAPEALAAAALGCAYGGVTAAAARGAPAPLRSPRRPYAECFPASDPFMEGFFPLRFFLDGRSAADPDADAALVSDPAYPTQISFEYVAPPRARALAPAVAHAGGGAVVFVAGADLRRDERGALVCALASAISSAAPFAAAVPVAAAVSSALVACETPSSLPAGAHAARVALAGADAFGVGASAAASAATLVATPPPTIRDASPTAVAARGGARVALAGTRLRAVSADDALAATFGTFAPVALTPGSASEATFASPARRPSANVAVGARRSLAEPLHARMPSGFAFEVVAPFTPLRDGTVPSAVSAAGPEGATETASAGGALVFVALAPPRFFAASGGGGAAAVAPAFFATPRVGFAAVSALAPVAGHDGGAEKTPKSGTTLTPRFLFADARGAAAQLEFRAAARVASVHPRLAVAARARAGGGSVLDVSGSDFAFRETRVRFGSAASGDASGSATYVVSSAYLRVEVFGDHAPGARVPMDLASAPGFTPSASGAEPFPLASGSGAAVEARAAPAVFRARPAFGSEEGGVAVALTGAGFRDVGTALRCRFGSVAATASAFVDANRVECVSPARAPDSAARGYAVSAPVAVTVNGRDFSAAAVGSGAPGVSLYDRHHAADAHSGERASAHVHSGREASFAYGAKLEVFSLDPTRGPASGGTEVVVRGAHFLGPFGGAPAGAAAALAPSAADAAATGELPETDRGFFFFGCKFDQTVVPATAGSVTPSSAACRSPPHAAGFVAVEVRAGVAGNFTVFGATFEFQAPPRADTLFPPVGAAGGGTLVSVAGANFVDAGAAPPEALGAVGRRGSASARFASSPLRCRFGGGAESAAWRVSSAVLRCETPSFAASAVDRALPVDVSLNGGEDFGDSTSQTAFEPLASPLVLSLEPRAGTAGGGTVVRVFGRGFTADAPVWCKFGTTGPIPAEYASEGAVRCKSPAKATASRIPVEVSRGNTLDLTTDAVLFSV